MVITQMEQLQVSTHYWRNALRELKEEFTTYRQELPEITAGIRNSEDLRRVEQLHNQFHIQLINIHDLKKDVKLLGAKLENLAHNESLNPEEELAINLLQLHETFLRLNLVLEKLRKSYIRFKVHLQSIS